jgi:hypothetical protein
MNSSAIKEVGNNRGLSQQMDHTINEEDGQELESEQ